MERLAGMRMLSAAFAVTLLTIACGREPSVASKSAAAYREAEAKGIAVSGGHEHGGHHASAASNTAAVSQSGTSADAHAGHDMTNAGAVDHSAHGGAPVDHASMGHSMDSDSHAARGNATPGGDPHAGHSGGSRTSAAAHAGHRTGGAVDHSAMGHTTASADHSRHGGASRRSAHAGHAMPSGAASGHAGHSADHSQHGGASRPPAHAGHAMPSGVPPGHAGHSVLAPPSPDSAASHAGHAPNTQSADHTAHVAGASPATDPHAQHRAAAAGVAVGASSNVDIATVNPAATLQRDVLDTPAPVSVSEAAKAAHGGGHEGHDTRGITPGTDHENAPTPMPATRDHTTPPSHTPDHSSHNRTEPAPVAAPSTTVYSCPMHPEVTSDKPGTCPKCGMALVKKN